MVRAGAAQPTCHQAGPVRPVQQGRQQGDSQLYGSSVAVHRLRCVNPSREAINVFVIRAGD